jgi:putative tryptophan/tyrosine transport system substrate-binding protein
MRRAAVALVVAVVFAALPARAQNPSPVYRVGFLAARFPSTPSHADIYYDAFRDGLRSLGYVEGRNLVIEWRFAEDRAERLPALASELAAMNLDVLVTHSIPGTRALQSATRTTPIVFTGLSDPVGNRVVASLAHPGGNATGMSSMGSELTSKRIEILKALAPALSRLAVFVNPDNASHLAVLKSAQDAGRVIGIHVVPISAKNREEIESGMNRITAEHAGGLLVPEDPAFLGHATLIAKLALSHRVASIQPNQQSVEGGGLVCYGSDGRYYYRHAANLVDRILKGARPADIPVEQPTTVEFLINGTTAKILGLTIPPDLLVQADKVIE